MQLLDFLSELQLFSSFLLSVSVFVSLLCVSHLESCSYAFWMSVAFKSCILNLCSAMPCLSRDDSRF